jgi:hypothetical protein
LRKAIALLILLLATGATAGAQTGSGRAFTYMPPVTLDIGLHLRIVPAFTIGSPPSVNLTWGASPTAGVSYNVYAAATSGGEKKPVLGNVAGGAVTFTDTTLAFGITRFYEVTACTGCKADGTGGAESTPTNEVSVQIPVQPSAPGTLQTPIVVYP